MCMCEHLAGELELASARLSLSATILASFWYILSFKSIISKGDFEKRASEASDLEY